MKVNTKAHWEKIFTTKKPNEVSWTQEVPSLSLELIHKLKVDKTANIIDIGGGDSKLIDFLLREGHSNVSVLDISEAAIRRAKERLGKNADKVKWIVSDILDFKPSEKYDVWHDRASFHFQTEPDEIEKYLSVVKNVVNGNVIIGTFSFDGPQKCSGLDIRQYDETGIKEMFERFDFKKIECKREDHIAPSGIVQNFVFCSFTNKQASENLHKV